MDPFACHWIDVEFHFEIDLQKRSAGNIYKLHQSYDTCISCQLEIHVILTTLHESLLWIYQKNTLLGLFPVTEFILHVHCIFLFDACKLSCCLHVHEIDTGTKGKDLHPNPITELFEIKKKMRPTFTFFLLLICVAIFHPIHPPIKYTLV